MRFDICKQLLIVLTLTVAGGASAAEWGNLTATFVLDGAVPTPKALLITKDQEVCGKHDLKDEQLVVNPKNKGIANIVVYLYVPRGGKNPPIHDSYKESESASVLLDNKNCRFEPRIVTLRTGQTLLVGNSDPVGHNTNITPQKNQGQNVIVPTDGKLKLTFSEPESLPSPVQCNIHPWMKGFVLIQGHPYMGVSDADGKVTIKNVPAGKWKFQVWQELSGFVDNVKQKGKSVKWDRGRPDITIKAGENDLGEIKLAPALFEPSN